MDRLSVVKLGRDKRGNYLMLNFDSFRKKSSKGISESKEIKGI